jgi:hypothetical protein
MQQYMLIPFKTKLMPQEKQQKHFKTSPPILKKQLNNSVNKPKQLKKLLLTSEIKSKLEIRAQHLLLPLQKNKPSIYLIKLIKQSKLLPKLKKLLRMLLRMLLLLEIKPNKHQPRLLKQFYR